MTERQLAKEEIARKKEEAVFIVPIFGALLLLPPLLNLFNTRTLLFGVPLEVLYLFLVWVLLIACAMIISASMPRPMAKPQVGSGASAVASEGDGDGG